MATTSAQAKRDLVRPHWKMLTIALVAVVGQIARAVIRDTPILILDEPTVGLDAASQKAVLEAPRPRLHRRLLR